MLRKYVTEDKSRTDTTKTKDNPEKANNTKYNKTKIPVTSFSCFLRHSMVQWIRVWGGGAWPSAA